MCRQKLRVAEELLTCHTTLQPLIFKCDIPVVFYKFNMYIVQLAVKTQLIYCTVCTMYKNYMFRPILAIFRFFV